MRTCLLGLMLLLVASSPSQLLAQAPGEVVGEPAPAEAQIHAPEPEPIGPMIMGGLGLGGLGFCAGFFASAALNDVNVFDDDVETEFYIGSACGAIGLSTGVHMGAGYRGNWLLITAASLAVGAAGSYWIAESPDDSGGLLILVPLVQLTAAVAVERWTTPDQVSATTTAGRARDDGRPLAQIGFVPVRNGAGVLVSGSF